MNSRLTYLLAGSAIALAAPVSSWAHGSQVHAGARPRALAKEQMPWGIAGDARSVSRTIEVRMTDNMRFAPDRIEVQEGETVRFLVHNDGTMLHEMVIGTRKALDDHAAMMAKYPMMEHDEAHMTHVKPGPDVGVMIWHFNRAGRFEFACLVPGHYQAGMVGTINVTPVRIANKSEANP